MCWTQNTHTLPFPLLGDSYSLVRTSCSWPASIADSWYGLTSIGVAICGGRVLAVSAARRKGSEEADERQRKVPTERESEHLFSWEAVLFY